MPSCLISTPLSPKPQQHPMVMMSPIKLLPSASGWVQEPELKFSEVVSFQYKCVRKHYWSAAALAGHWEGQGDSLMSLTSACLSLPVSSSAQWNAFFHPGMAQKPMDVAFKANSLRLATPRLPQLPALSHLLMWGWPHWPSASEHSIPGWGYGIISGLFTSSLPGKNILLVSEDAAAQRFWEWGCRSANRLIYIS